MKEIDIEFLRLTTDICYIIKGYLDDLEYVDAYYNSLESIDENDEYGFVSESRLVVYLNMNEAKIRYPVELTRAEIYSIEKIAIEHGLKMCPYSDEQELEEFNEFIENYDVNE